LVAAGREKAAVWTRARVVKFTSRILEGLMARRDLVKPRVGIGWAASMIEEVQLVE
jgi:hypothetical protein